MKHYACILFLFIFIYSANSLAFENNIGGNTRIAAMGFTQTACTGDVSSFLGNPAYIGGVKSSLTATRLDLFGTGVFYDFYEATMKISPRWEMGVAYESVVDRDTLDNSGYEQQLLTVRLANQTSKKLQLGANLKLQKYSLFDENLGSGNTVDFGVQMGPFYVANGKLFWGLKADDVIAFRKYKSQRIERLESNLLFGGSFIYDHMIYAMDLRDKDLRIGLEYQVTKTLQLRAGLADGKPTLGFGIKGNRLRIDYAYWIAEVGATHCVGSSIVF